jgi:lipoprotein-anchoring transpeptidase ErfK/SrfK
MRRRVVYALAVVTVAAVVAVAAGWLGTLRGRTTAWTPRAQSRALSLVVDKSERRLYVRENGEEVRSFPVAVGSDSHPTPSGRFSIRHITWNPAWIPPDRKWARNKTPKAPGALNNPMGNVKMYFSEPDYYIHGTRDYDSLGQPDSHGCVRLANGEAIGLAEMVMEAGGAPRSEGWVDRVLDHFRDTRQVYLSDPIPVTIRD